MENKIRNTLNDIYFSKTKDIVNGLRSTSSAADNKQRDLLKKDLANALHKRNQPAAIWTFLCRSFDQTTLKQLLGGQQFVEL